MSEKINKQHFFRARIHEGFKWRGENGLRGLDPADMQPVVDAEVGVAAAGRGHIKPCKRVLGSVHAPETWGNWTSIQFCQFSTQTLLLHQPSTVPSSNGTLFFIFSVFSTVL